ncbi:PTS mannose transporter subunit IIA [Bordetella trematum]|uniref:PTS system IIa component n=1 Tax=Bordetella trematum TaxID=123899 RepID=A0A157SLI2_9BORD|nr:PTS mannose transporter subunit IIA [Bordetella trematum]AUL46825.1 PTS mannose transporter subunit IIA [Bordetella trematum]AZR93621.1 PTS mannose transporter subunit IIA [Bordetella trematum]NNH17561.1 PTS mannose transporter subunit IIA [Bordetella trematum]QIM72204.1 PTS mannose transporter subunit IIA [Bordetella trematum]SAI60650.1 PTS system IIa component [Bordetella trematum]
MTGIVIVVHAPLGSAMRESVRHVLGEATDVLAVHDIEPQDMPDDLAPVVLKDVLRVDRGQGVLVLTDLIGATPANIAKRAVADARALGVQCCLLAGLNTPMLMRALTYRNMSLAEAREKALAGGVQGCLRVD